MVAVEEVVEMVKMAALAVVVVVLVTMIMKAAVEAAVDGDVEEVAAVAVDHMRTGPQSKKMVTENQNLTKKNQRSSTFLRNRPPTSLKFSELESLPE